MMFLEEYEAEDTVALTTSTNSSSLWNIPSPNRQNLMNDLKSGKLNMLQFSYRLSRPNFEKTNPETFRGATEAKLDTQTRQQLVAMLESHKEMNPIEIPFIFPKILSTNNNGKIQNIPQLLLSPDGEKF